MIRPVALAVSLALTLPTVAAAQSARQCGPRDAVVEQLENRFSESRQAMGLAANNAVVELYANPATGTWTITATMASGLTCLIASGEAYQALAETLTPGEGT